MTTTTEAAVKTCTGCRRNLPRERFSRNRSKRDGLRPRCKDCDAEYREANRERIAARDAEYREANRERYAARQAEYYEANRERIAEYRERNRERIAEYKAERYAAAGDAYRAGAPWPVPPELVATECGYRGAHSRVRWYRGLATTHACDAIGCDRQASAWALVITDSPHIRSERVFDTRNGTERDCKYSLDPDDYRALCHGHHIRWDQYGHRFPIRNPEVTHA